MPQTLIFLHGVSFATLGPGDKPQDDTGYINQRNV